MIPKKDIQERLETIDIDTNKTPSELIHYTDSAGLLGIINSSSLWASHAQYLNDESEISYSHDLIEDIKNSILAKYPGNNTDELHTNKIFKLRDFAMRLSYKSMAPKPQNDVYLTSFCETEDVLSQWRSYSNIGNGYAIGFKTKKLKKLNAKFKLRKVIYSREKQLQLLKKVIEIYINSFIERMNDEQAFEDEMASAYVKDLEIRLLEYSTYFKHPSFKEEKEWRMVFIQDQEHSSDEVNFRSSDRGIIPYLVLKNVNGNLESQIHNLPISKIVIGPTVPSQNQAKKAIEMAVKRPYPKIDVRFSHVPLRT